MVKEGRPLSTREVRQHDAQFRVMQAITENPNITQRQLASLLGISLGRAHYCVASLIAVGWVKVGNFRRASNKLSYAYILTPSGMAQKAAITREFLQRKIEEYTTLQLEIEALEKELSSDERQTPIC